MQLHCVMFFDGDGYDLRGIFSTEKLANDFIEQQDKFLKGNLSIEARELDKGKHID